MTLAGWTPRPVPGCETLNGRYVDLEPLQWDRHGEGLFAAVAGPHNQDLWRYMPVGPFLQPAPLRDFLEQVHAALNWQVLVFRRKPDQQIVGMASYMRLRPEHGSAEIGCVAFGDALKRTVAATEGVYLMGAHLFDQLGYRRFEWKCHNDNAASKRAATRFGFAYEGVFRNDMVVRGANRDTAWYAMTDDDWPGVRAGFVRWLDAANFDPDGGQRQTLEALRA